MLEEYLYGLLEDTRDCVLTCLNQAETAAHPEEPLVSYYRAMLRRIDNALEDAR